MNHLFLLARRYRLVLTITVLALFVAGCGEDDPVEGPGGSPGATGSVRVLLLDTFGGQPLLGVPVVLDDRSKGMAPAKAPVVVGVSDRNGLVEIHDVPAGSYTLQVQGAAAGPSGRPFPPDHYVNVEFPITVTGGATTNVADPVRLAAYSESSLISFDGSAPVFLGSDGFDINIPAGAVSYPDPLAIEGLILLSLPVTAAPVPYPSGLVPDRLMALEPAGTTFDPAELVIADPGGLPPGTTVDVLGLDRAGNRWNVLGTATLNDQFQFISTSPLVSSASMLTYACEPYTVTGIAVDDLDMPVAGVNVIVQQARNTFGPAVEIAGLSATTAADGSFSISGVRACVAQVRFEILDESGSRISFAENVFPDGTGTTDVGRVALAGPFPGVTFTARGVVADADGNPLAGIQIGIGLFTPEKRQVMEGWSRLGPLTRRLVGLPEGVTKGGFSPLTPIDGSYEIRVTSTAGNEFEVFASNGTYFSNMASQPVPAATDNGSVVDYDVVACPIEGPCSSVAWSLAGMDLIRVDDQEPCEDPDDVGDDDQTYTVLALTDGELSLRIEEGTFLSLVELERVGGTGPTGVTRDNLVGLYRVTDQTSSAKGQDVSFMYFGADGRLTMFAGFEGSSGTYTTSGSTLFLAPTFAQGERLAEQWSVSFTGNQMVLLGLDGRTGLLLDRCNDESGSAPIEGVWGQPGLPPMFIFADGEFAYAPSFFFAGE